MIYQIWKLVSADIKLLVIYIIGYYAKRELEIFVDTIFIIILKTDYYEFLKDDKKLNRETFF